MVLKRATCQILPNSAIFHQIPLSSAKFCYISPNSAIFHQIPLSSAKFYHIAKVTNHDFPCPA